MVSVLAILLFFAYLWGLGFGVSFFVKNAENIFERNLMCLGFGMGAFMVLAALLTILHIPLYWWIFLLIALLPLLLSYKFGKLALPKVTFKKEDIYLIGVLILFLFSFFMYHKGAFLYPYYEDGDPWRHAGATKYIAVEHTALEPFADATTIIGDGREPATARQLFQYIDAYPPGYDTLFAMLYQVSGDIVWTVKFFNALLISLGIILFYFFAKIMLNDPKKALFSTFILAMLPSYMSHFIWALVIPIFLIYPLFYTLEMVKHDKLWWIPTAVVYAGILLSQPTHAFVITLFLLVYLAITWFFDKEERKERLMAAGSGFAAALMMWWIPMFIRYGMSLRNLILAAGTSIKGPTKGVEGFTLKFWGTADRVYTFNDFLVAKSQNMINNPIGIGVVVTLLIFMTLAFAVWHYKQLKTSNGKMRLLSLAWLLLAFLGVMGASLPVQFWAFRWWMFLAMFASLTVGIGMFDLLELLQQKAAIPPLLILLLVIPGVWLTSGKQKYDVNTAMWGSSGEFVEYGQEDAWNFIRALPKDTRVYYPCFRNKIGAVSLLAYDKYTCMWCDDQWRFDRSFLDKTTNEVSLFLKQHQYEYLFIDANCAKEADKKNPVGNENKTNEMIGKIQTSGRYALVHRTPASFIWRISS